jgi:hypothetical protein
MRLYALWTLVLAAFALASNVLPSQVPNGDLGPQLGALYGGNTTRHTNNWAVLVCASRFWFNYRVSELYGHPGMILGVKLN